MVRPYPLSGIESFLKSIENMTFGELLRRASAIAISAPRESSLGERIAELIPFDTWYSYLIEIDGKLYQVVISKYNSFAEIV